MAFARTRSVALPAAACLGLLAGTTLFSTPTSAQPRSVEAIMDEVIVTARKRSQAERVQATPLAVTAFGSEQLEALQFRDLSSLSFSMPNVATDDVGTTKGVANFSIRGLGINSSIPSIDPTVGVFIDGMYLGVNHGVVLDMFDLEAIEVLRGPQGILFGRNVTGGAVLVRTRRPTTEPEGDLRIAAETGRNLYYNASLSGPLLRDSTMLSGRLSAYFNEDDGWHENRATGRDFGQARTRVLRPSLLFTPTDDTEILLRYEYGEATGDGPAGQNRALFDRDSFRFAIDEPGFYNNRWQHAILELNQGVAFGDGVITNIFGWRRVSNNGVSDIDSTPMTLFHGGFVTEQEQFSNELRYAGRFADRVNLTAGVYYLEQDIGYQENRQLINPAAPPLYNFLYGGGLQEQTTWGVFSQVDIELNEQWILNLGARYTHEEKDVRIGSLPLQPSVPNPGRLDRTPAGACNAVDNLCAFDFVDGESWHSFTPKIGLEWLLNDNTRFYGFWTQGVRSGGYNFRNTSAVFDPGPFDEEKQDSFELGMKYDTPDQRGRLNAAVFYNEISDMQREVNLADPFVGVVQVVRNTADATIYGLELEGHYLIHPTLLLSASAGYLWSDYSNIRFDIAGDGVAGSDADKRLDLPRLAPFTGSVGLTWDLQLTDLGYLTTRVSLSHRDRAPYTDDNRGMLSRANMLDASIAFRPEGGGWSVSLYGKNLLDEVTEGGDTQLPAAFGGPGATFSPLNKGRIIGAEVKLEFGG